VEQKANEAKRRRIWGWGAVVCAASFTVSLLCGLVIPHLIAEPGQGPHTTVPLSFAQLGFGLLAAGTVPLAWRWVYRRGA
jgi:hypothetical protein